MADPRTAAQIEQDLAEARARLAKNISQLVTEIHPRAVSQRTIAESKRQGRELYDDIKAKVVGSAEYVMRCFAGLEGRKEQAVAIAGAAATLGLVILMAARKK